MKIYSITWDTLYTIFTPSQRKTIIGNFSDQNTQEAFAVSLLSPVFFQALFIGRKNAASRSTVNRIFQNQSNVLSRFNHAKNYILTPNSEFGELPDYGTAEFWTVTLSRWETALQALAHSSDTLKFQQELEQMIHKLLDDHIAREIDDSDSGLHIHKYVSRLIHTQPAEAMTFLTFMASTIPFWNQPDIPENQTLFGIFLNTRQMPTEAPVVNLDQENAVKINTQKALHFITAARENFQATQTDPQAAEQCCSYCTKILELRPLVDRNLLGEAAFMIYRCSSSGEYKLPKGSSPIQYLKQSNTYGYDEAASEWKRLKPTTLIVPPEKSTENSEGICFFNVNNEKTRLLEATKPTGWKSVWLSTDNSENSDISPNAVRGNNIEAVMGFSPEKQNKLIAQTVCNKKLRYFFLCDESSVNFNDTLTVLHTIKNSPDNSIYDVEIFLLGEEAEYGTLIDTTLSHIEQSTVRVHILDEAKRTAQYLLSYHPLYYPLYALMPKKSATLHFVIVGDSPCTEWLIREAFWLMSFRQNNQKGHSPITTKITLLAPQADQIRSKINVSCPGMISGKNGINYMDESEKGELFNDISFAEINYESVDPNSYKFQSKLEELFKHSDEYFYFAVAGPSDTENLTWAIHLREWIIRQYIRTGQFKKLDQMPVISYRCSNPHIDHISRSMVVQLEEFGNRWFNNHALIPFGSYADQYSWDNIDGGILEKMAQCIHLQYNSIPAHESDWNPDKDWGKRDYQTAVKDAMKDYYGRLYNRDSSFAMAMSLSYRLFQCRYRQSSPPNPALPSHWSILDGSCFSDPASLEALADKYIQIISSYLDAETNTLAQQEHARWIRFMCARGWLPATMEQTVNFMKQGNPRQQLYIARLHPCMCSYEKLDRLSTYLKEHIHGFNKDFKAIDIQNVKSTPAFLKRMWLTQ